MPESKEIQENASLNRMFFEALERRLGNAFAHSPERKLQGLWCDGILDPLVEMGSIQKIVNDKRELVTTAYIGNQGEQRYEMRIRFGPFALRRVARNTSLLDCIPCESSMDWITLDMENKEIEIRLR